MDKFEITFITLIFLLTSNKCNSASSGEHKTNFNNSGVAEAISQLNGIWLTSELNDLSAPNTIAEEAATDDADRALFGKSTCISTVHTHFLAILTFGSTCVSKGTSLIGATLNIHKVLLLTVLHNLVDVIKTSFTHFSSCSHSTDSSCYSSCVVSTCDGVYEATVGTDIMTGYEKGITSTAKIGVFSVQSVGLFVVKIFALFKLFTSCIWSTLTSHSFLNLFPLKMH